MLLQLFHFSLPFIPLHPLPWAFPHLSFMSMGHIYKFFGFSISHTILNLPLFILNLLFMLLFFKLFFIVVQVWLSPFSPPNSPQPSHPYLPPLIPPPLGFVHESFIVVPENPFPLPPLSPPPPLWLLSVCS